MLRVDVHALLRARSCFVDTNMPSYELSLLLRVDEHALLVVALEHIGTVCDIES